jgi:uncharacterized protein
MGAPLDLPEPTVVHALAVAETPDGFVGSVSTISITAALNGTGHVFVDTAPLAQVDMQGSARLAVRVASAVTGIPAQARDVFVVVRSDATVIGGPSAGGIMTVGAIAALEGWPVNQSVMMTGTINADGDIGPIGGLLEKIDAARAAGATLFLFPEGMENTTRLTSGSLRGPVVHVPAYCGSLGMRCEPVGNVEQAVRFVTGHEFERPPLVGNVTSQDFLGLMRPLASNLTAQARALMLETSNHFDRVARTLPSSVRTSLSQDVSEASRAVVQADAAFADGRYYTASSRSYQASVTARGVDYILGLYETGDRDGYVRGLLDDADLRAHQAALDADQPVLGVAHLEGLGAAQERASEAEGAAADARRAYDTGDAGTALLMAAQARERSASVGWWLDIASKVSDPGQPLTEEQLNRTARDLLDTARESVTYAELILQESGGESTLLSGAGGAADLLERADADVRRGFLPAAIFEALQAEVRASAALELAGSGEALQDAKLDRARERAAAAIVDARAGGLEPILAQSYFELAGDLADPENALAFYNTARSVAALGHSFFATDITPRESRFVGFDPLRAPPQGGLFVAAGGVAAVVTVFAVGLALGAGVAILAVLLLRPTPALPQAPPYAPPPPPAPSQPAEPARLDPFVTYTEEGPAPPPK